MSVIQQGLLIAGIGMGLVFAVIIFLWGLMALLLKVTSGKNQSAITESEPIENDPALIPEIAVTEGQRRAAAAAVAVQLAINGDRKNFSEPSDEGEQDQISPWQTFHRNRQLDNTKVRG